MGGWDCSCKEENKQHNHLGIVANEILSEIGICIDLNIQIKISVFVVRCADDCQRLTHSRMGSSELNDVILHNFQLSPAHRETDFQSY